MVYGFGKSFEKSGVKVYLSVQYSQRVKAKELGCFWNPTCKFWYTYKNNSNYDELIKLFEVIEIEEEKKSVKTEIKITEDKTQYPSLTVCNFCKSRKLSKSEIEEIEKQYYFLGACQECKQNYILSQYI